MIDLLYRLMLSCWYKPEELAPRVAFMYAGNTVANGFGGLLAAGILSGLKDAGVCSCLPDSAIYEYL